MEKNRKEVAQSKNCCYAGKVMNNEAPVSWGAWVQIPLLPPVLGPDF